MREFFINNSATIFQGQSFLILVVLAVGIAFRKKRPVHISLMSGAMIWDLLLILQIELSRSAVLKALQPTGNTFMLNTHIILAFLTGICYLVVIYTGRRVLTTEKAKAKFYHRIVGITTLSFRILTFITSFFAVASKGSNL